MLSLIDRFFIKKPLVRRFITQFVSGNHEETVTLLAGQYQVHTLREHGFYRASKLADTCSLFRDETPILIHLAGILNDGDTFLDIGANIGVFAANIASFLPLFPNLKIYAFEPNEATSKRLQANVGTLGVEVFNLALSDRNGALEFVDGAVSSVYTTVENASAYSIARERSVCESRRLDDLKIEGDSLVMKIDVEGQEWEVLQGALSYFRTNRVKALYLDGYKDPRIRRFLADHGFNCFNGRTLEPAVEATRQLLALRASRAVPCQQIRETHGEERVA